MGRKFALSARSTVKTEPTICNGHLPYHEKGVRGGKGGELDAAGWLGSEGVQNILFREFSIHELTLNIITHYGGPMGNAKAMDLGVSCQQILDKYEKREYFLKGSGRA